MRNFPIILLLITLVAMSCTKQETANMEDKKQPVFNAAASDAKAISIADSVVEEMGGKQAWNNLPVLSWNFFGSRAWVWNKQTGQVRMDNLRKGKLETVIFNLNHNRDVQLKMEGEAVTQADSLEKYRDYGISAWNNDAYWVVMPFKLQDPGVTLKYLRADTTLTGEPAHVLQLTFEKVGDTPDNRYEIYVSKDRKLIAEWAYYAKTEQDKANFRLPWDDYGKYGKILLATDRGRRKITDLAVYNAPADSVFNLYP